MNFLKHFLVLVLIFFVLIICFINLKTTAQEVNAIEICDAKSNYVRNFVGFVKSQLYSKLSFQSEGQIVFFPYSKGDFIKKGQILARLDGVLYKIRKKEEQARLNEALIEYEKSKSYYDRMNILHKEGAISDNDWEEAYFKLKTNDEQIKIQREKINYLNKEISYNMITAPFDGYIIEKYSQVGSFAKIGEPVLSVMSSDKTRIEIMVSDEMINKLFIDKEVVVEKDTKKYKGKIKHIAKNSFDLGGYLIKIDLDELILDFTEGMNVDVQIAFDNVLNLQIPIEAIFEENDKKFVYKIVLIDKNLGQVKKQSVETGKIYKDKIEILSGLKSGDYVVCKDLANINLNKRVKIKNEN